MYYNAKISRKQIKLFMLVHTHCLTRVTTGNNNMKIALKEEQNISVYILWLLVLWF